jgi:hypothetical protein
LKLQHLRGHRKSLLIRRSPDLEELIREVKSWVIDEEQKAQQPRKGTP